MPESFWTKKKPPTYFYVRGFPEALKLLHLHGIGHALSFPVAIPGRATGCTRLLVRELLVPLIPLT